MNRKSELENEINNRFLDIIKFLKETYPNLELDIFLRFYHLELVLNGSSIVYNLEKDPVNKERILNHYTEAIYQYHKEQEFLQEQIKKISPVGAGPIRSEIISKSQF